MGKRLVINSSVCDARKVKEETLASYEAYEGVNINSSVVLVSPETQTLLSRYRVKLNCSDVLSVEGDVVFNMVNGTAQIKASDCPAEKQYMMVNGSLEIGPGAEDALRQYVGIQVNGTVTLPESLSGYLGKIRVNGSTICYPDGAIVLKRNAVIDRVFTLRAKNSLYWAAKRMIMVDPQLDPQVLRTKGATFAAKEVILAESKVEALIGLIDERADIVIVPDGTSVILDDLTLDETAIRRYGKKLYIIGDVTVDKESEGALAQLEYLHIRGNVTVAAEMRNKLLEIADAISGDVVVKRAKSRIISDVPYARISQWLLEQSPEGIHVEDVAVVQLDPDVDKKLILERLTFEDCAAVKCSSEQEDAVAAVSEDVAQIGEKEDDPADKAPEFADETICTTINAAYYIM